MKLPNKVIRYHESILSKFPIVLSALENNDLSPAELFYVVKDKVDDAADFMDIVDCLYALRKISYDETTGRLSYVV